MNTAILVAPKFDEATEHSYDCSRDIKSQLEKHGYEVIEVNGGRVHKELVEEKLKENEGAIYIHYDHGSEDAHYGSETEQVINTENVGLLSGREVYCMNCSSAKKLGVEAWRKGAKAYWGYNDVFVFTTDALDEFKEFSNSGLIFRLGGKDWMECLRLTKQLAEDLAQKLAKEGKIIASVILQNDANILRCYTPDNPPDESGCVFRRTALKLFGNKVGWRISRKYAISVLLLGLGTGIFIHDRILEWEVLSCRLHGIDAGFFLVFIACLLLSFNIISYIKGNVTWEEFS